jgi:L,D-peptidoglycan transpeptidase YkuD (ErfK/YbiS/YcfS/YnhG family)
MSMHDLVLTPTGVRVQGQSFPCRIGRGGSRADKAEGDGATPVGTHRIIGLLYRPDRVARPNTWAQPIRVGDLWSDASGEASYNHPVRAPYPHSHEALRRADPLYDVVWITDWNYPAARAGKGSAIFLHQWRSAGYPTAGCIAFRRDVLHALSERIGYGTKVVVPEALAYLG